jgi:hypothetical protein
MARSTIETALCNHGGTMPAMRGGRRRSGRTEKISVSIDRSDLSLLQKRARRLYGGNLSAAIAEGVRRVNEEEGREALVAWLGHDASRLASSVTRYVPSGAARHALAV